MNRTSACITWLASAGLLRPAALARAEAFASAAALASDPGHIAALAGAALTYAPALVLGLVVAGMVALVKKVSGK